MIKIVYAVIMLVLSSSGIFAAERFVEFPTLGVCTGDYVRYRARPDTNADIWGRLHTGEKVIVESRTRVNGEVWYEILPKDTQESAFVFGKYLTPCYGEEVQKSPVGKLILEVLQTYCPYRDYDYWGEYDGEFEYPEIKRSYDRRGWLVKVEAWQPNKDFGFGELRIGDSTSKLTRVLGEPDNKSASAWTYEAGEYATFTFRIRDGKIVRMIYEESRE